jgi:hypothetical protein
MCSLPGKTQRNSVRLNARVNGRRNTTGEKQVPDGRRIVHPGGIAHNAGKNLSKNLPKQSARSVNVDSAPRSVRILEASDIRGNSILPTGQMPGEEIEEVLTGSGNRR